MIKKWSKLNQEEWFSGSDNVREWLEWCEVRVENTIGDCIEILEKLRLDYDKYYERQALANAIRYLQMYADGEDVDS